MGRNHFPQTILPKEIHHPLYYSNNLTLILTAPNEEKEPFHSAISILFYHSMKTSPLQPRLNQNPRTRLNQKSFLKQSLPAALKSRLPTKSTMLTLILTQIQFQIQIEKTETLTRIQILKLEILDLGLGLVPFDVHRVEMKDKLMMNREISKVLLLRLVDKPNKVLNPALVQ